MGLFKNLFKKRKSEEYEACDWDKVQDGRSKIDFSDAGARTSYVLSCLDQMKESSDEIDRINDEYNLVTAYLTDMEEIEALTGDEKERIESIARHLHDLRKAHDHYVLSPSLLTEAEYDRMEAIQDEVPDGVKRMKEEEQYKEKVKSDLIRLSREKQAYEYRKHEMGVAVENSRGIALIAILAGVFLMVILVLLQVLLQFEVKVFYYLCVVLEALTLTIVYIKYTNAVAEKQRVIKTTNELILLENKVKIRYVNNKNLLDYLYTKFGVTSAAALEDVYTRYLKEKEERKRFERNEAVYEDELNRLVAALSRLHIKDPHVWIHQSDALYDSREMVEIRHGLIGRRQKLRKQLEYNEQIALEASDEIKNIIKTYPESAESIVSLVDSYEKEK